MTEIMLKEEVFNIVGAAMEVHNELGPGFLEPVYQEAFGIELGARGIPFLLHVPLTVCYKGQQLTKHYYPDAICYNQIIVELKALRRLSNLEEAQLLNYLKATGLRVGLLINFRSAGRLEWKRFIM